MLKCKFLMNLIHQHSTMTSFPMKILTYALRWHYCSIDSMNFLYYLSFSINYIIFLSSSHEVADVAGLTSFSFGIEEEDRYVMIWKKVHVILARVSILSENNILCIYRYAVYKYIVMWGQSKKYTVICCNCPFCLPVNLTTV